MERTIILNLPQTFIEMSSTLRSSTKRTYYVIHLQAAIRWQHLSAENRESCRDSSKNRPLSSTAHSHLFEAASSSSNGIQTCTAKPVNLGHNRTGYARITHRVSHLHLRRRRMLHPAHPSLRQHGRRPAVHSLWCICIGSEKDMWHRNTSSPG